MNKRTATPEDLNLSGEDLLNNMAIHVRHYRNLETSTDWDVAGEALRRLMLYVGKNLLVRSLDESLIIEKSHFEYRPYEHPRFAYVTDGRTPRVAEAAGKLDVVPAFDDNIRLQASETRFLFPRAAYYHVDMLDRDFEPRVAVELLDTK